MQIRFQEIGGALEAAFSRPLNANILKPSDDGRQSFIPISTTIASIQKCWSEGFYLPQIFVRFWKLTLQILARTSQWIDEFIAAVDKWSGSDHSIVDILVFLHMDITRLRHEFPSLLAAIKEQLDDQVKQHVHLLEQCFDESNNAMLIRQQSIQRRLVAEIVTKSLVHVKQVSDIPRMFRKTNRDVPTKSFAYVDQMLEGVAQFSDKYEKQIDVSIVRQMLTDIFGELNLQ